MTSEQASQVVAVLNAIFWHEPLERETIQWWVHKLTELDRPDVALGVADAFGIGAERFPTYHQFLQAYRAECQRVAPPAIEEGPRQKPPEWVLVWTWLRRNGDYRTMPQQPGWDMSTDRMTQAEYEQAAKEWLAETGGKGEARLPSARAL